MRSLAKLALLAATTIASAAAEPALADDAVFEARFTGSAAAVPPNNATSGGFVRAVFDTDSLELTWLIIYENLSGPATDIRIHGPAEAGAVAAPILSVMGSLTSPIIGGANLGPAEAEILLAGQVYIVIATQLFPEGEIRAQLVLTGTEAGARGE